MAMMALIYKDLLILTRDRRALATLLVMPMAFIAIIGLSTGKLFATRDQNARLRVVVVDQAKDGLTTGIVAALKKRDGIKLETAEDPETAYALVDDGDQGAAVVIGAVFRSRVDALELGDVLDPAHGRLASGLGGLDIHLYARATNLVGRTLTEQLVFATTMATILPHVARRDPIARAYLEHRARGGDGSPAEPLGKAFRCDAAGPGNPMRGHGIVYQIIVPGYTVLFAFFLINIMARSFIAERDQGTLLRVLVSPIQTAPLLVAKAAPFFLVSFAQGVLLFVFGKLLFGMSWGPYPWMLVPLIASTSLAATGLGLLTAVVVRTDSQVSAYGNLVVIVLAGVSGCFMPRAWLPEIMRTLSLATPHAWALIGYDQLLVSARPNVSNIVTCCSVLCVFGIVFLAVSWLRFRRLVDQ